jgi:hypothetical protein
MEVEMDSRKRQESGLIRVTVFITMLMCMGNARAATYYIPAGSIGDHSNSNTTGSIAWYFKTYGSQNTYVLTSGAIYQIGSTLNLPYKTTLTDSGTSILRATSSLDNETMLNVVNDCTLKDLEIDGRYEAKNVIYARNRSGIVITNCVIKRSKNDYVSGTVSNSSVLIDITGTSNVMIIACSVYNAGYPKTNIWDGTAYCIRARGAKEVQVKNCPRISDCLTAGVDITDTLIANIEGNTIHDTGKNYEYGTDNFADGISGYHNTAFSETTSVYWVISGNHISNSSNHGMHLSGKDIIIDGNTVENHRQYGIAIFDFRTPVTYSSYIAITDNTSEAGYGTTGQNAAIYVDEWYAGTITADSNSHTVTYGMNSK